MRRSGRLPVQPRLLSACQAQRDQLQRERERASSQIRAWQDYAAVGDFQRQAVMAATRQAELHTADEALAARQAELDEQRGTLRQALGPLQAREAELQGILWERDGVRIDDPLLTWLVETYTGLEEVGEAQLAQWKNEATVHGDQAARIIVPEDAVQMYEVAKAEADERRKVMEEANSIVAYWETQEEETRRAFEQMTNTYFNRINHRFQTYLEEFGWTGRIEREHRGGTRFGLDVLGEAN